MAGTAARSAPRLADLSGGAEATAFTGCLAVAAALAVVGHPEPRLGLLAIATVAVVVSRRTGPAHAVVVAVVAWLFDDGFVADAARAGYVPGVLRWHGAPDVLLLGLLVVLCFAVARRGPCARPRSAVLKGVHRHG